MGGARVRAYDGQCSDSDMAFRYCDTIADFYEHVWGYTEDVETKRILLARLIFLGFDFNRYHVRDVLTGLFASFTSRTGVSIAVEELNANPAAATWTGETALKRPMRQPIAEALRAAQQRLAS